MMGSPVLTSTVFIRSEIMTYPSSRSQQLLSVKLGRSPQLLVQEAGADGHEDPTTVRGPLPQALVQVCVLLDHFVLPGTTIEVHPRGTKVGKDT